MKSHDWKCLINDEEIENDVIDDYLDLLYQQGKRMKKLPGMRKAEFDKRKITILPVSFYYEMDKDLELIELKNEVEYNTQKLSDLLEVPELHNKKFDYFDKIFIPIWLEDEHWVMCVVRYPLRAIECYDSENKSMAEQVSQINKFLEFQGLEKCNTYYIDVPHQTKGKDCGVFIMESVRVCLHEGEGKFKQGDMPNIRKRILRELQNKKLETGFAYRLGS